MNLKLGMKVFRFRKKKISDYYRFFTFFLCRFMVANRKIKSGEIIFREFPAFIGPTTNAHDHIGAQKCVGCFGKLGKCPKECPQCRVLICHEKCAKSDGHQLDCQFFSR